MRRARVIKYICKDGPYRGEALFLSGEETLVFKLPGHWHGYYLKSLKDKYLHWIAVV